MDDGRVNSLQGSVPWKLEAAEEQNVPSKRRLVYVRGWMRERDDVYPQKSVASYQRISQNLSHGICSVTHH